VSELADDLDLESSAARREGSNPSFPTKIKGNDITLISFEFLPRFLMLQILAYMEGDYGGY
jgi:hypothetical protein